MQIATSSYWNVVHGRTPGEAAYDLEGTHTLEVLGENMAWQLKMREAASKSLSEPMPVNKVMTSFIREDLKENQN